MNFARVSELLCVSIADIEDALFCWKTTASVFTVKLILGRKINQISLLFANLMLAKLFDPKLFEVYSFIYSPKSPLLKNSFVVLQEN